MKDSIRIDDADPTPSLGDQLAQLEALARHLLATQLDLAKLRVRQAIGWAVLGVLGLAAATTAAATAVALLLIGVGQGLGRLFPSQPWLGNVVLGLSVLGLIFGGTWLGRRFWERQARRRTIRKYEERGHEQRKRFGRDITAAATAD